MSAASVAPWTDAQSPAGSITQQKAAVRKRIEADLRRQATLLRRSGVDAQLFEWMDRINHDRALVTARCPTKRTVQVLVFSDRFLRTKGAAIATNRGPRSQAALDRVLQPYGLAETTCFWS